MNSLIDAAMNRTRGTMLLMIMVVLAGLIARSAIPVASEPHIEVPFFYVGVVHEGISPEDSERLLVMPMEIELRKLEGIDQIKSTASEGVATFFVEFDASQDLNRALNDVREDAPRSRLQVHGRLPEARRHGEQGHLAPCFM